MKTIKYYHKNSDVIAYKKEIYDDGYWEERTCDDNGNLLTYKNSTGYCTERTYNDNGSLLTIKNYDGYHEERTYDEEGDILTFKNSDGYYEVKGKRVNKEEFEEFINSYENPILRKIVELENQLKKLKKLIE